MSFTQQYLMKIVPHSAFGVTMLTLASVVFLFGFFAHDIHVANVTEEESVCDEMSESALPAGWKSVQLHSGEQYRTGSKMAEADRMDGIGTAVGDRYGDNRSGLLPGCVALLTRTCECRWADDSAAPVRGTQFRVGQILHLTDGLAEIAFSCGAKAILEGPAILELQSEKSSWLRAGRMTANVPDDVQGFMVRTPTVQLVSLSEAAPRIVAEVTATVDCMWAEDAVLEEGTFLQPGQSLNLLDGLVEVTFASGAKVILQGPANLEIESAKSAILRFGRLTANVPDDLHGFKIRTPTVEIDSVGIEAETARSIDISPTRAKSVEHASSTPAATSR